MSMKRLSVLLGVLVILSMILTACPAPAPQVVEKVVTQVVEVEKEVKVVETQVVETVKEVEKVVEKIVEVEKPEEPVTRTGAWLDTIVIVEEPSADAAVSRLQTGDIDLYAYTVSNKEVAAKVAADPNLGSYKSYGSYNELTFNPAGPVFSGTGKLNPFAVPAIREAMNYLIDRTYIAEEIMGGLATPRWLPFNIASTDYVRSADVARQLELKYAYDLEKAKELITAEMEKIGATVVDGKFQFEGAPVEIIVLIRTEDERRLIGDYVANQLEAIGFAATRDYKKAADASPIWQRTDPNEGKFHIYTGGWITTAVPRTLVDNFSFFYTARGLGVPLWQAYTPSEEFNTLAEKLENNDYTSMEERTEMMAKALDLALQDSVRLWLVDRASITPKRAEVQTAYDLYGAVYGTPLWARTIRRDGEVGGSLKIAMPSILTEPWNPIGATSWVYDAMIIRGTTDLGVIADPYTGLALPNRIEKAEILVEEGVMMAKTLDWLTLDTAPSIEVPADAWADWDAATQKFITAGEKYTETMTAKAKVTVHYPADFGGVKWHDGSPFTAADVIYRFITQFDRAKEASPIFDASYVPDYESFMSTFKGMKVLSANPLVFEYYTDSTFLDAEDTVATWYPAWDYGAGPWHTTHLGALVEAAGGAAFSAAKADEKQVEWLSYIAGPTLDLMKAQLPNATITETMPYEATLSEFITADDAATRWANLTEFNRRYGHFWVGTGPFYLERAFPVEGTILLQRFADHPDSADRWASFGQAAIAEVEVEGSSRVTINQEAMFDVLVTFNEAPYAQADIEQVKYLVFDANGALAATGEAAAVEDGKWQIKLAPDVTGKLEAGSNKLEVVVVSKLVAVPSFASAQFVTAP
jgi:peptide/nickel transport system substrate-binding protein